MAAGKMPHFGRKTKGNWRFGKGCDWVSDSEVRSPFHRINANWQSDVKLRSSSVGNYTALDFHFQNQRLIGTMNLTRSLPSLLSLVAVATVFCTPVVKADQPKMHEALADLEAARTKLEHAEHDKGGHRERALEAVNNAIAQIKEGMHYDRRH